MPIVKAVKSSESSNGESSQSGGEQSSGNKSSSSQSGEDKNNLFDARRTALFLNGKKVGELSPELTQTYNALFGAFEGTSFAVDNVDFKGQNTNYLLTAINCTPNIKLYATENDLVLKVKLSLYCKVVDHSANGSTEALSQNQPIPDVVKSKAEKYFEDNINDLILTEKQTGCDFMNIKQKLYRFNHKEYSRYKDNYLSVLRTEISVSVYGQH